MGTGLRARWMQWWANWPTAYGTSSRAFTSVARALQFHDGYYNVMMDQSYYTHPTQDFKYPPFLVFSFLSSFSSSSSASSYVSSSFSFLPPWPRALHLLGLTSPACRKSGLPRARHPPHQNHDPREPDQPRERHLQPAGYGGNDEMCVSLRTCV